MSVTEKNLIFTNFQHIRKIMEVIFISWAMLHVSCDSWTGDSWTCDSWTGDSWTGDSFPLSEDSFCPTAGEFETFNSLPNDNL